MTSKSKKAVAIIIPAYNEATVIDEVINDVRKTFKDQAQIILIDDGSRDETVKIAGTHADVHIIKHVINMGQGAAVRTGFNYALRHPFKFFVIMDSDGQHRAIDAKKVLEHLKKSGYDMALGSRLIDHEGMPWHKVIGNKGLSFLTKIILGVSVTDSQSGMRVFNRKALESFTYHENTYAFCSEMLWRAQRAGLKITEFPIKAIYTDYSTSATRTSGQNNWNAFLIVRQLIKHRIFESLHG